MIGKTVMIFIGNLKGWVGVVKKINEPTGYLVIELEKNNVLVPEGWVQKISEIFGG